ncbi:MAG TPA: signal peptide peptidase SppA [Saprospiraceae bacterium]|nr:signal peptide peptidase SppA [Saprospiraceae bacterium]HNT19738.1 signal peptide peptidase SppA [Saprospiraceae bacterium]
MNFLKILLGSCLGTLLAVFLVFFIGLGILSVVASSAGEPGKKALDKPGFLEIRADLYYPEKTNNVRSTGVFDLNEQHIGLHDLVQSIQHAASDPKIKGILYRSGYSSLGSASALLIRQALLEFKASGKPIYAYGEYFTEGSYSMASVADRILLNPNGVVELKGFGAMIPFFKEFLDKTGISFEVYYAGQFKSATEPVRFNKMSDQNRSQIREYLEDLYRLHLEGISESRGIAVSDLRNISNEYLSRSASDAIRFKLADTLAYQDDVYRMIQNDLGLSETARPSIFSVNRYFESFDHQPAHAPAATAGRIAIVFAEGEILDGEGHNGQVGSARYLRILRKIRQDDKIKALVLRINSPGGSSMASDNILHEINLIREAGKPVVVSMGDYAASGGYYIACSADSIFAEPNTITGSIGVFFMIPNLTKLMGDKLGIDMDTVRTGKFTTAFTPFMPWSSEESLIAQQQTDMVYDRFLSVVSKGRNMDKDDVEAVAQGRVWSGVKALEHGLVDRLGGMQDALDCAVRMAKLDEYKVLEYPAMKDPIQQLLEDLTSKEPEITESIIQNKLTAWFRPYARFASWTKEQAGKPLMRMPFELSIR